jgi:hypothetical protein
MRGLDPRISCRLHGDPRVTIHAETQSNSGPTGTMPVGLMVLWLP